MWFGVSVPDELVAHWLWERNIYKAISVNVSDFPIAELKLRSPESMRCQGHAAPGADDFANSLVCTSNSHNPF